MKLRVQFECRLCSNYVYAFFDPLKPGDHAGSYPKCPTCGGINTAIVSMYIPTPDELEKPEPRRV